MGSLADTVNSCHVLPSVVNVAFDGFGDKDASAVAVGVVVGVGVVVDVGVGVDVDVDVAVAVGVDVAVWVDVDVAVGVGVGVAGWTSVRITLVHLFSRSGFVLMSNWKVWSSARFDAHWDSLTNISASSGSENVLEPNWRSISSDGLRQLSSRNVISSVRLFQNRLLTT